LHIGHAAGHAPQLGHASHGRQVEHHLLADEFGRLQVALIKDPLIPAGAEGDQTNERAVTHQWQRQLKAYLAGDGPQPGDHVVGPVQPQGAAGKGAIGRVGRQAGQRGRVKQAMTPGRKERPAIILS
jgi:hypothetical protein